MEEEEEKKAEIVTIVPKVNEDGKIVLELTREQFGEINRALVAFHKRRDVHRNTVARLRGKTESKACKTRYVLEEPKTGLVLVVNREPTDQGTGLVLEVNREPTDPQTGHGTYQQRVPPVNQQTTPTPYQQMIPTPNQQMEQGTYQQMIPAEATPKQQMIPAANQLNVSNHGSG